MPRKQKWTLFFIVNITGLLFLALSSASMAESNTDKTVERLEVYLNSLRTLEARFLQHNPDGGIAKGKLYLQRPGKLRFKYDPPVPIQLFADSNILIHVDTELEQVSHYPLDETPAHFLLRKEISLSHGLQIQQMDKGNGILRITLTDKKNTDIGSVTLTFSNKPLELKAWMITDAQGLQTELTLVNSRFGGKIDASTFHFINPYDSPGN